MVIVQKQFDDNNDSLARLSSELTEPPDEADLEDYALDLQYVELQRDLFEFVFPRCLEAWRRSLFTESTGFVEQFHAALAARRLLDEYLSPSQREAVFAFMRESMLERLGSESRLSFTGSRVPPYTWVGFLGSFGVLVPEIDRLWTEWWTLKAEGHCVAALQYASCLMYPENQNPIFAPWTGQDGGGPPALWEAASVGFNERWLDVNTSFLRSALTASWLEERVQDAAGALRSHGESDVAQLMVAEIPNCRTRVVQRIPQLIERLRTPSKPGERPAWAE